APRPLGYGPYATLELSFMGGSYSVSAELLLYLPNQRDTPLRGG
ncbi:21612_t:CDS:2, partial [Gigaspora margarita]